MLLGFFAVFTAQGASGNAPLLKAAFVYNFAKFTRWPVDSWRGRDDRLHICVAGSDSVGFSLKRLRGETIHGRDVVVVQVTSDDAQTCQLAYIAAPEHGRMGVWINKYLGDPVLTISEIRGFADAGGMIQLFRAEDRIRFRINLATAREGGLVFDARLLDLAARISGGMAQ